MGTKKTLPVTVGERVAEGILVQKNENEVLGNHPIHLVLKRFANGIRDYVDAISTAVPSVAEKHVNELKRVQKELEHFSDESKDGRRVYRAHGAHAAKKMIDAANEADRLLASQGLEVLSKCLFIGFFTLFDAFIGDLLKAIHEKKPDLFKSIKREISLSDLLEFDNIDLIKKDMLDKEIDSFRRESYIEQFAKLESKFELKTLRTFPEWKQFVEMGQRRNLFTHNGGRVSQQYLVNCEKEGVPFAKKPIIDEQLKLDIEYLIQSLFVVGKVGFMLGHTLWRKVLTDETGIANESLNTALYDLLANKRWRAAAEYGLFGLTQPMKAGLTEVQHKIRVVNTAIALKKIDRKTEASDLTASVDWTACLREFSLAKAILEEDYKNAADWMNKIGREGELIDQLQYHLWPLFEEFRGTDEFQKAYKKIYGIDFAEKASSEIKSKTATMRELNMEANPSKRTRRSPPPSTTTARRTRASAATKR